MKNTTPEKLEAFIKDAAAYLRLASENDQEHRLTLSVLSHDITGLANDEPCFLPRVTGYSDAERLYETR